MNEFDLIQRHFKNLTRANAGQVLGIGDDCALLAPEPGQQIAVSTDSLIAGRHFLPADAPFDVGYKSLAVSLSDLAAMGARPRWFTLALSLENADSEWLTSFAAGLRHLAEKHDVSLVGGDTTRGPLNINITAIGTVPAGQAIRRSDARPGNLICVTGTLGDAALALSLAREQGSAGSPTTEREVFLMQRLHQPTPRCAEGQRLAHWASAAIDLSDGLAGDLSHILTASGVGALINEDQLPMSAAFSALCSKDQRRELQLRGGDDYELCLCIPAESLARAQRQCSVPLTVIGEIVATPGLRLKTIEGDTIALAPHGYRHFE